MNLRGKLTLVAYVLALATLISLLVWATITLAQERQDWDVPVPAVSIVEDYEWH